MKLTGKLVFISFLAGYCLCFLMQENLFKERKPSLQPVPVASFLRAATGYLHQVTAELLFVQSAVFLGGINSKTDTFAHASALAHNYRQITALYPEFNDPYFFAESYLASISSDFARTTNEILTIGRNAHPNNFNYPFFQGYNLFYYLDEPLKASELFGKISNLPNAPQIFGHLAVVLSAQGGQLQASIISLQMMLKSTNDKIVKRYYQKEIIMFRQAIKVQKAVNDFHDANMRYPNSLEELVPKFIFTLPTFGQAFELTWNPPIVGLSRPRTKAKQKSYRGPYQ